MIKNYLILSALFVAVIGFALSPAVGDFGAVAPGAVSDLGATTYNTGKVYFKPFPAKPSKYGPDSSFVKKIDNRAGNEIQGYYTHPKTKDPSIAPNRNEMIILPNDPLMLTSVGYNPYIKLTKADVEFRKIVNGKTYTSSKSFTVNYYDGFHYYPKNDYQPYSAVVYYQKR